MSRSSVILLLILVVIIAGLVMLSRKDVSQPLTHVEKTIPNEKLGK